MIPPAPTLDVHPIYGISARTSRARDREPSLLNLGTIQQPGKLSRHKWPKLTHNATFERDTSGAAVVWQPPTAARLKLSDSPPPSDRVHEGRAPEERSARAQPLHAQGRAGGPIHSPTNRQRTQRRPSHHLTPKYQPIRPSRPPVDAGTLRPDRRTRTGAPGAPRDRHRRSALPSRPPSRTPSRPRSE